MGVILLHFIYFRRNWFSRNYWRSVLHFIGNKLALIRLKILILAELEEVIHFNFENVMKEHGTLSINSEIFIEKPRPSKLTYVCYVQNL